MRKGRLKRLFERCGEQILKTRNPVIVPVKVVDELTRQSGLNRTGMSADRIAAVNKATRALELLDGAEAQGLIRKDLGDHSNPYADDLFVRVFEMFADRFAMCLLTNDVTLLLRIRLLAGSTAHKLYAGGLTGDGMIQLDSPHELMQRGRSKLRRKLDEGDQREVDELEPLLADFERFYGPQLQEAERMHAHTAAGRPSQPVRRGAAPGRAAGTFRPAPERREPDRVLDVTEIPGEGDAVLIEWASRRGTLVLGPPLGEGGEGTVFPVGGGFVVKVFDREHITRHRKAKIDLLVWRGFRQAGICFPQALVINRFSEFVGYLCRRPGGGSFSGRSSTRGVSGRPTRTGRRRPG